MFQNLKSHKFKVISFGLLVLLNLVLRIPSIPHEKGRDSFFIHSLANSINAFGQANWWEHWLSIFGYYPYSYASGLPFTLSGMSQLMGINVETSILIYSFIFGVFSIFIAFTLAGLIYKNYIFQYFMAFFFSISPGIMLFTTWEASARGPFMIFLPFFIYLLLKKYSISKKLMLSAMCITFLFSLHHYAIFAIVLTMAYIVLQIVFMLGRFFEIKYSLHKYEDKINLLYLFILVSSFMYPFLTHTMITAGSRYGWIIDLLTINLRFIGPAAFFAISGVISLSLSAKKSFSQWYFLISFIFMVPFVYDLLYGHYLLLLFSIVFLSIGFKNSIYSRLQKNNNMVRVVAVFAISIILVSTLFTAFYNHSRTGEYQYLWYMNEKNYDLANWIDGEINHSSRIFMVSENNYEVRTIALVENEMPILVGGVQGFAYGYINDSYLDNLEEVPMTSSYFYSEGPYRVEERDIYRSMDWYISNKDIKIIKDVYTLDYLVQSRTGPYKTKGLSTENAEIIYSNGILDIYNLRQIEV
ncbi:hypothetical protein [Methanolobus profundi]|uniref:Membrane protein 6-pyruvoyl-tetrahydropterin synthase-related domain-containing protein n=1 Tax=Methanolobus profundi TaxID=487685 RepID=A0A1I4RX39_9EURY|nr:hypothetical protein [Methanolobus profundi]SFM56789.1 hypothetical protein SAMN04488696_1634 [Methanolobus profundi]